MLTALRNPTLSYTQRLEERIKELEDQLVKARTVAAAPAQDESPSGRTTSPPPTGVLRGHESSEGLAGTFKGLKLDERGVLTYHGATSFFHLPSDYMGSDSDLPVPPHPKHPLNNRRERLVNNAWHQRALENLSEIPVRQTKEFPCASAGFCEILPPLRVSRLFG